MLGTQKFVLLRKRSLCQHEHFFYIQLYVEMFNHYHMGMIKVMSVSKLPWQRCNTRSIHFVLFLRLRLDHMFTHLLAYTFIVFRYKLGIKRFGWTSNHRSGNLGMINKDDDDDDSLDCKKWSNRGKKGEKKIIKVDCACLCSWP